jgi:hypothetical protein
MTVQTNYALEHSVAYAGMVNTCQPCNLISKLNKTASVIPYGVGVVSDGEDGVKPAESGSVAADFVGVAMYEINRAQADGDVAGITVDRDGTIVAHGELWVYATETVVKDEPAFLRVGATNTGYFSNAAGTGATLSVAIAGAKFLTGGATGELVKITLGIGG